MVCLSLDGAEPESHDALRGPGSFREVVEAAALCELKGLPFSFKSVITNFNKDQLMDLALLATTLGARDLSFLTPFPTPRSIQAGVIPAPGELLEIMAWISGSMVKALRLDIHLEAFDPETLLFKCHNILDCLNVDYQGNLLLCCNLSHVTGEKGQPSIFGAGMAGGPQGNLSRDGLVRHYHAVARLMEARVAGHRTAYGSDPDPCYWCLNHFGKLEWLRDFPESPWSAGVWRRTRGLRVLR